MSRGPLPKRPTHRPKAEFAKTNAAVIDAMKSYAAWMKSDLLPRSNGDFRYGADTFRKALALNEMVDIPLDHLLQIGYDDLHKNQAEFARVAKEIDPTKTPQQELAELAAIHPAPDRAPQSVSRHASTPRSRSSARTTSLRFPATCSRRSKRRRRSCVRRRRLRWIRPGPFETHSTKAYLQRHAAGDGLERAEDQRVHGGLQCRHDCFDQRA